MNFASDEFLLFLPLVFFAYWTVGRSARLQNVILLLASYLFYGWWDGRFLLLLVLSSVCDFFIAGKVDSSEGFQRRTWLWLSVSINLGILGAFKYFGFFVDSFVELSAKLGVFVHPYTLDFVLPIGISFYTFQTLGYTIDVYKRRTPPCQSSIEFLTFVAFFPQLVAGPIERAGDMLVQFHRRRHFVYKEAASGFRILLWGFFKKLVIADNCAPIVDFVWSNSEARGGLVWLAIFLFSFQIYADFSGYSDIAVGTARFFGIRLSWNFRYPYFSSGLQDFWRRWHVTLSLWFRDYVYIPLGGKKRAHVRNLIFTFLLSGLWHGANWTYLGWGLVHGVSYVLWAGRLPRPVTFVWVSLCWVVFRAPTLPEAYLFVVRGLDGISPWHVLPASDHLVCGLLGVVVLILAEARTIGKHDSPICVLDGRPLFVRWVAYIGLSIAIYLLGNFGGGYDFIYFQF